MKHIFVIKTKNIKISSAINLHKYLIDLQQLTKTLFKKYVSYVNQAEKHVLGSLDSLFY